MKKDIGNRVKSSIHYARYVDLQLKASNSHISAFHFTLQGIHEEEKIIDSINPLIEGKEFSILLLGPREQENHHGTKLCKLLY
ncbi:hypothetical protein [Paraflavitalea speifideaquila]|uniref:hypothetical protein n=1 Tax=Paraflavitalea speifideaquila TaxID=3076558 RepID=UPI0028ED8B6D|nr:hypothetical protein [Paraflavitalea speifideiaquila]